MAKKEYISFLSSDGKTKIHAVKWSPDSGQYRAVFQIVHGMVEYVERYSEFASYLTEQGFLVVGHDQLGHGNSVLSKKDWGYIASTGGSHFMIKDIHKLRVMIQNENRELPYFILGHSMGSYLLRKYLTKYGKNLAGALIMGTGTVQDFICQFGMKLIKIVVKYKGWRYRNPFFEKVFFFGPFRQFDMDGTNKEESWLTRDIDILEKYYADERCTFYFTLNGYYTLLQTISYDNQREKTEKIPKTLPIFLLSGMRDPVGNFGKGVKRVEKELRRVGIQDITCKLYEESRHEILNEIDRQTVYEDIADWCETRMKR